MALPGQPNAARQAADDPEQATIDSFHQHPDAGIITSFPGLGLAALLDLLAGHGDSTEDPVPGDRKSTRLNSSH